MGPTLKEKMANTVGCFESGALAAAQMVWAKP